jgi:hypothetical protein
MVYCQATPLPVLQYTLRSLNPELCGSATLSRPLWAETRMGGIKAAGVQLHHGAYLPLVSSHSVGGHMWGLQERDSLCDARRNSHSTIFGRVEERTG